MKYIPQNVSEQDALFLEQFETLSISPQLFTHKEHVHLAWIYLTLFPPETAISKICTGIKTFDIHFGIGIKYHETVTRALAHIVHSRIKKTQAIAWENFIIENPDLLFNYKDTLYNYYSPDILFSEKAQNEFVTPDKKQL